MGLKERVKISVIITAYNDEDTLDACIMSIVKQNYRNVEVIIVDDGSLDNTLKICKRFATKYEFINVFTQNNQGVSASRNRGIGLATGDYLCFLDADDTYLPSAFITAMRLSEYGRFDIIMGGIEEILGSTVRVETADFGTTKSFDIYSNENLCLLKRWTLERNPNMFQELPAPILINGKANMNGLRIGSVCSKFFKKKLFDNLKFDEKLGMCEDLVLVYMLFNQVNEMIISDEIFYRYYNNDKSVTHQNFNPRAVKDNLELSKRLTSFKNDFDDSFHQFVDFKVIECFWRSVISGIVANPEANKCNKYKQIRKLLKQDIYRRAFEQASLMLKNRKQFLIALTGKLRLAIVFLIIGQICDRRRR
ncbi:glycosyltransferase family 2 protein [Lactiplantibacillus songbeiensis]|uniref:Glycosyltransferase family 2 protein n=1 Tax=Lactiplantibacillus songbeiensis TaxID=2559920 RepID=A0ABW4C2W4_9LACO|nr:glycosyltransferase [Lactiplantibacillus songbeiensis]